MIINSVLLSDMDHVLPVVVDKGSGSPIVLLHGLGNTAKSWEYTLEHLDYTKSRVIVLDLLGFGDAPKPRVAYTPEVHAKAVINTLTSLSIANADFAGHSMGSIVAIEIAHLYPQFVRRLSLFGAPLYKREPRDTLFRRIICAEGLYFSAFKVVKKSPDAVQAGGKIADELIPFIKGIEITEETWPAYASSLEHTIMQFKSFRKAKELSVPVLFVNGLLDMFIIRSNIKEIVKALGSAARLCRTLGPHELTPRQGKLVAKFIQRDR